MSYTPVMTLAQVLWDVPSYTNRALLVFSGTVVAGFEPINAFDWRDFSLFNFLTTGTETDTLDVPAYGTSDNTIDAVCLWWLPYTGSSLTVTIQVQQSSSYVTDQTVGLASAGGMMWVDLTTVYTMDTGFSQKVRFQLNATGAVNINFRQLSVGKKLQFPMGQWSGVSSPVFTQGMVVENVFSVNGSIIGRNLRRLEKVGALDLNYLDPTWVRTWWQPFAASCTVTPFWWRWDPVNYPQEIAFAVANEVTAPVNDRPAPLMKVNMAMKFLTP